MTNVSASKAAGLILVNNGTDLFQIAVSHASGSPAEDDNSPHLPAVVVALYLSSSMKSASSSTEIRAEDSQAHRRETIYEGD